MISVSDAPHGHVLSQVQWLHEDEFDNGKHALDYSHSPHHQDRGHASQYSQRGFWDMFLQP